MGIANHENRLLIATANKAEVAMGYGTLYGDLNGALLPLGDMYKTEVYGLCHWLRGRGFALPIRSLTRAPSAELAPKQKDEDSLPHYAILDAWLADAIERGATLSELSKKWDGLLPATQSSQVLWKKLNSAEFKRRQTAPILKLHQRAFGIGWKMPILKKDDPPLVEEKS